MTIQVENADNHTFIECPLCKGTKLSPISTGKCRTCDGIGEITSGKNTSIMRIRKSIGERLASKGIEI